MRCDAVWGEALESGTRYSELPKTRSSGTLHRSYGVTSTQQSSDYDSLTGDIHAVFYAILLWVAGEYLKGMKT